MMAGGFAIYMEINVSFLNMKKQIKIVCSGQNPWQKYYLQALCLLVLFQ